MFFSVTYTVTIGMARYVPQVCYKLPEDIRATVEEMVDKGLAKIYEEEVRFISGSPVPVKKPPAPAKSFSSASVADKSASTGKGKNKKSKGREFE